MHHGVSRPTSASRARQRPQHRSRAQFAPGRNGNGGIQQKQQQQQQRQQQQMQQRQRRGQRNAGMQAWSEEGLGGPLAMEVIGVPARGRRGRC